jgi:hypothetical protein
VAAKTAAFTASSPGELGGGYLSLSFDDEEEKWLEEFMRYLRRIYEILGGDPSKLGSSPDKAMTQFTLFFVLHGVPQNLTHDQITEALSDVQALSTMLQSPPSSVDPGTFPVILAEIEELLS